MKKETINVNGFVAVKKRLNLCIYILLLPKQRSDFDKKKKNTLKRLLYCTKYLRSLQQ